jgi:hypothetical protein
MESMDTARAVRLVVERVVVRPSGCIEWTGAFQQNGYGTLTLGPGDSRRAHRLVWELFHGPIAAGMTVDHLCRNVRCVNIAHLDVCTLQTNNARRPVKTHCPHGHAFTVENTLVYTRADGHREHRLCRTCVAQRNERAKRTRMEARHV